VGVQRMGLAIAWAAVAVAAVGATPVTAQPYVYVLGQTDTAPGSTNAGPQYVTVIDTATRTKVTRITAGTGCMCIGAEGMTLSRDGAFLYVANEVENSVTVISTASNSVVDTMAGVISGTANFRGPIGIEVSPDDTRLYVLSNGGAVEVFDRVNRTRVETVPLNVVQTRGLAVTPDGARLYVSTYGSQSVKVVDLASSSVIATVPLPGNALPLTVEVTPDGRLVYVAAPFTNSVAVIDTQTNTLVTSVALGAAAYSLAIAPAGDFVYAVIGNGVKRISTATHTVTTTVTGAGGNAIDFSADGTRAWTTGGISQINTATNTVAGAAIAWNSAVEGQPAALVVTPGTVTPPSNPAPTNLAATVVGNRVSLTWTAPTSGTPTGYVLEGGTTPGSVLASLTTGGTGTTFAFDAPTGTFYIRIHATTASGRSPASNEVMIRVNLPSPPAAPTGLLGLVNGTSLALAWQNPSGAGTPTSVLLDVSGAFTGTLPLAPTERFLFFGVPPGTYTFAVRAANAAGASPASSPVTLTFPGGCSGAPQTPTNFVVTKSGTMLSLSWSLPAAGLAPTSYRVNVDGALVATVPLVGRSISGAVPSGSYSLSITAANACGQSGPTPTQSVTVP
jgi:YVTN family beta-propeller protein